MVERLQLSQQMRESVYCFFQKILIHRTTLFFNRHIDQVILCCFYGVAKVCLNLWWWQIKDECKTFLIWYLWFLDLQISQLNLTFKEIIFNYRKQPHCKPQVFRSVYIDWASARRSGVSCRFSFCRSEFSSVWILKPLNDYEQKTGSDHVDIITFYNEVFIPAVKPLLVELTPMATSQKDNQVTEAGNNNVGMPFVIVFVDSFFPKNFHSNSLIFVYNLLSNLIRSRSMPCFSKNISISESSRYVSKESLCST